MKIGYYDHTKPSALIPLLKIAKHSGVKAILYSDLPGKNLKLPKTFFINPLASTDPDYWENIRQCVQSHPKTNFVLMVPAPQTREHAQKELSGQKNVEYIALEESERLLDILGI